MTQLAPKTRLATWLPGIPSAPNTSALEPQSDHSTLLFIIVHYVHVAVGCGSRGSENTQFLHQVFSNLK